jgi:hypothetical protein
VALPVLHIVAAATYLSGYYLGFGANISVFASATDLFSVSTNELFFVYLGSVIMPATVLALRFSTDTPYAYNYIDRAPEEEKDALNRKHRLTRKIVIFISCLLAASMFIGSILIYLKTGVFTTFGIMVIIWAFPSIFFKLNKKWQLSDLKLEILMFVFTFYLMAVLMGINTGQLDRHIEFKSVKNNATCFDRPAIRRFDEDYLVVDKLNAKLIVDRNCKAIFRVPPPTPALWK